MADNGVHSLSFAARDLLLEPLHHFYGADGQKRLI